ncbi:MAG: MATE family efflux transporter [Clostridiales bacterium]|nr:MATE family efflux transporter [Clostridiales bacterium]
MENLSDFTQGSIPRKLIRFMLPILAAQILQTLYGAVDLLVVGHFGSTAGVSAISTGASLMDTVTFLIFGLTTGVTIVVSQYLGSRDTERIGETIGGAVAFFLIFSLALTVLFELLAPQLARLMQAPAEAFDKTVAYIRICGGGMLFIVSYNAISAIFRGFGNSTLPLLFVAVACVVNVLGDLLLVAVLRMDVAGAAIATVAAQALSVVFALLVVRRRKLPFPLTRRHIRFNRQVRLFLKMGAPIAIQNFLTSFSFLALCSFINRLGLTASSGYGVANKVNSFLMLIPSTLLNSLAAFVGQNVGAQREDRARNTLLWGIAVGVAIGIPVSYLAAFHGDLFARIFVRDAAVIAQARAYLRGFSIEPVVTSILFCLMGYFNGHGRTRFVMIQGLVQSFAVRIPVSYFMSIRPDANLTMIGIAAPLSTIVGIVICLVFYVYCRRKIRVGEQPLNAQDAR